MKKILIIFTSLFLYYYTAFGLNAGAVTIQRVSAPFFGTDIEAPCTNGPRGAYVAYSVRNNSLLFTLNGLNATLGSFSVSDLGLGLGQAGTQSIGALAPGASKIVYWYVTYPCVTSTNCGMKVTIGDASPGVVELTTNTPTREMKGTYRVGMIADTAWSRSPVVGQSISFDVTYKFGAVTLSDEFDFQPTGQLGYNAGGLRLTSAEVLSSDILGITAGSQGIGFSGLLKLTSPSTVQMRYTFTVGGTFSSLSMSPYASQRNATNHTYTGNYSPSGTLSTTLPLEVSIAAVVTSTTGCGEITYNVVIRNPSNESQYFDKLAVDVGADVNLLNIVGGSIGSSLLSAPILGTAGELVWSTNVSGNSPGILISAGDSATLSFAVAVDCGVNLGTTVFNANARTSSGVSNSNIANVSLCIMCPTTFPVVLSQFEGKWQLGKVLLSWQTESEKNNLGFSVERSEDGYIYEVIGFVPSASNSDVAQNYTFEDENSRYAKERKMHYRLKIIDIDGTFEYSPVVEMLEPETSKQSAITFTLSPNPVVSELTVISSLHTAMATTLKISDVSGHTLISKYYTSEEVAAGVKIDVSGLPQGIYIINMYEKGEHNHQLFTKL